jgi:hypothetical protein
VNTDSAGNSKRKRTRSELERMIERSLRIINASPPDSVLNLKLGEAIKALEDAWAELQTPAEREQIDNELAELTRRKPGKGGR